MANEEFDAERAQEEFNGYLSDLNEIIRGLRSDYDQYINSRIATKDGDLSFSRGLKANLQNSRRDLDRLIERI